MNSVILALCIAENRMSDMLEKVDKNKTPYLFSSHSQIAFWTILFTLCQ